MDSQDPNIKQRLQKLVSKSALPPEPLPVPQSDMLSEAAVIASPSPETPASTSVPVSIPAVNPFTAVATDKPLVALRGQRNGYLTIAPAQELTAYKDLPEDVLAAAWAWAMALEELGSSRAYWITLSEQTRHLHVHIFPRWPEDTLQGIPLFETRNRKDGQPPWTPAVEAALQQWVDEYQVELA